MKTWTSRILFLILLVATGLSSWLLIGTRFKATSGAAKMQPASRPDYSMVDAVITRYAADGRRRYVAVSPRVMHLPRSGITRFAGIRITSYNGSAARWMITARKGRLDAKRIHLYLNGRVHARQLNVRSPINFLAPSLVVNLDTEWASSPARVLIRRQGRTITGLGFKTGFKTGTLELLNEVSGHYGE